MTRHPGFTLVELLVVITIIVVLLSLLVPALDQAIYQAELAVCGAQLDGIASGTLTYALGANRRYPPRRAVNEMHRITSANDPFIEAGAAVDDRPTLRLAFPIDMLRCPMAESSVDFDHDRTGESNIFVSYRLFFGVTYAQDSEPQPSMFKVGDDWGWDGRRFNVLAGDEDYINNSDNTSARSAHPDKEGLMTLAAEQRGGLAPALPFTFSEWVLLGSEKRGPLDTQYAFTDGSVSRYTDVRWDETDDQSGPIARVPHWWHGHGYESTGAGAWGHAPRR